MTTNWNKLRKLVVTVCHGIPKRFDNLNDSSSWYLQHTRDNVQSLLIEHIRRGVEIAASDSSSLFISSGGQTIIEAGPRSEAQGYWLIAEQFKWWSKSEVRLRSTTEEFALDSYQNLLFSICRFKECVESYPEQVIVVGWGYKAQRFDFHRASIRFPKERFHYESVNNPVDIIMAQTQENLTIDAFHSDPYGVGEKNGGKRLMRNPFKRQSGYHTSCPELGDLLDHHGSEIFLGHLPWD